MNIFRLQTDLKYEYALAGLLSPKSKPKCKDKAYGIEHS